MTDQNFPSIVILISGTGSNMLAIATAVAKGDIQADIRCVLSNNSNALGLTHAREAGIEAHSVDHRSYDTQAAFEQQLKISIDAYQPDLIVLAGFMRVLSADFVRHYCGRMLNIHPSLLPKYPGLNTHQRALQAQEIEHGCSVHFVTETVDGGPIIIQAKVPILETDTQESLKNRVQQQEHLIYPIAVKWFTEGRLSMVAEGAQLDHQLLPHYGVCLT